MDDKTIFIYKFKDGAKVKVLEKGLSEAEVHRLEEVHGDWIEHTVKLAHPEEKTGHWEYVQYDGNPNIGNLHCSECDRIAYFEYNYCPNCGARMVSE